MDNIESVGVGILDFFNAEAAKGHAEGRRVFAPPSQLILMPTELILLALAITYYSSPKKRVAKFCDRVGESALALRIAAAKKA